MKKTILNLVAICFLTSTLAAQEISRLQNYHTKTYLNTENGRLHMSNLNDASNSVHWEFIDAGNKTFRIKNRKDGTFLNIESGKLNNSAIENGWLSAFWALEKIEDSNLVRIHNIWKPYLYLNVEEGLACSPIMEGWLSALWKIEPIEVLAQQMNNEAESIDLDAEDVNTNEINTGTNSTNELMKIESVLAAHNTLRREVGVPPLEWSTTLASKAQNWADYLMGRSQVGNLFTKHSDAAENLATGNWPGTSADQRVLKGWGENEKVNFNPETRKCYSGKVCGHYTQIVWRKTTKVGCGIAINSGGEYILICQYDPPGNFNNEPAF